MLIIMFVMISAGKDNEKKGNNRRVGVKMSYIKVIFAGILSGCVTTHRIRWVHLYIILM